MKYCYQCGKLTAGDPYFCQFCGRTYDVKLCPRRHINPRIAQVCGHCGSRELSTPQPKVSPVWKLLEWLARAAVVVLIVFTFLALVAELVQIPRVTQALVCLLLLFGALWAIWAMVPNWLRRIVRWSFSRGGHRDDSE